MAKLLLENGANPEVNFIGVNAYYANPTKKYPGVTVILGRHTQQHQDCRQGEPALQYGVAAKDVTPHR